MRRSFGSGLALKHLCKIASPSRTPATTDAPEDPNPRPNGMSLCTLMRTLPGKVC